MKKLVLELTDLEYKTLLECYSYGMAARGFMDEKPDPKNVMSAVNVQTKLCQEAELFGMENDVLHDAEMGMSIVKDESEIGKNAIELMDVLTEVFE